MSLKIRFSRRTILCALVTSLPHICRAPCLQIPCEKSLYQRERESETGTYCSRKQLMDQPCPRANRPSHTIEVNVQALVALKLSHSSAIEDTAETSDTKLSHEKKHRLAGSGSNIRAITPPIEKG